MMLRVMAVSFGMILSAHGAVVSAEPPNVFSTTMKRAEMRAAAIPAADSVCKIVLDANDKLLTTPFHMYMTQSNPGIQNGKPISTEMVFAGGARYILYDGKWTTSPMSSDDLKALEARNRANAKNTSCQFVRDETVNGESAALFSAHSESEHGKDDSQIWISKSNGLVLKQETVLDTGGANGKSRLSVRYEYGNVQAPKL
jgi:hypothetical protein